MYNKSIDEIKKMIDTTEKGLSSAEAAARLNAHGKNQIRESKRAPAIVRFFRQFKNVLIIVLLFAMGLAIALAIADWHDGGADKLIDAALIGLIVLLNAYLGFSQESKAEKAIAALRKSIQPYAKVLRDGTVVRVKTYELVPGDIAMLEAGDIVPADLRLIESASLMIEEASLTGESVPSEKNTDTIDCTGSIALGDQKNMAFMSGVVTFGRGTGIVVGTGMATQIGLIADTLNKEVPPQTPLTKRLHTTSKMITAVVLVIAAGIFISRWAMGESALDSMLITVAIAVCAIPEGLPACTTATMAIAVQRMSKRKAIVRNLPAVETLGSTEIICSDKTGTLTLNRMTVQHFYINQSYEVAKCNIELKEQLQENESFKRLMRCMMLCNDTNTRHQDGKLVTMGDPTETALIHCAYKFNLCQEFAREKWARVCELPFDSDRKLMSTIHVEKDAKVMYTKGALDNLIGRCTKILVDNKVRDLTQEDIRNFGTVSSNYARNALRVLGYAYKPMLADKNKLTPDDESDLILIGFTGKIDPPREEVYASIKTCREAGVMTVMITGDHKDTAFAIAKEIGIAETEDQVMTGAQLDSLSDQQLAIDIHKFRVYARVNPEHKTRIVKAFKAQNKVVAMTGDGVNDAPSIKAADIGIGMGITGTDVTKGVADVILTDDNFATIVTAVEEGRRTYDNIKKIFVYLLGLHLAEVILLTGIIVVFNAIAFLTNREQLIFFNPLLILWINVVTNTLPAIAMGALPASPDVMKRNPIRSGGSLFRGRTGEQILVYALFQVALVCLVYFTALYGFGFYPIVAVTMSYLVLGMVETVHCYNLYNNRESIFHQNPFRNLFLNIACLITFALVIGSIALPITFFHDIMEITQLTWGQWAFGMVAGLTIVPLAEIYKMIRKLIDNRKST